MRLHIFVSYALNFLWHRSKHRQQDPSGASAEETNVVAISQPQFSHKFETGRLIELGSLRESNLPPAGQTDNHSLAGATQAY